MATIIGSIQESGLGFGPQAVSAAGGMDAYRQEMDRLILSALTGDESGSQSTGVTQAAGQLGSIDITS